MSFSRDHYEDEKIQKDLRDELNPGWRGQLDMHYKTLHIDGPVNKSAKEIINRAMVLEGFAPKRKRINGNQYSSDHPRNHHARTPMKTINSVVWYSIVVAVALLATCIGVKGEFKIDPTRWSMVWTNGVDHPIEVNESDQHAIMRRFLVVETNQISLWAQSGEICKVYGHNWRDGRPGEGSGGYYADYHPNTNFRTCRICGVCQQQDTSWK